MGYILPINYEQYKYYTNQIHVKNANTPYSLPPVDKINHIKDQRQAKREEVLAEMTGKGSLFNQTV